MVEVKVVGDIPTQQTPGSAGFDLKASQSTRLDPGAIVSIPVGSRMAIPAGHVGLVCSRSGLSLKGVFVVNAPGVVDSDYRGDMMVILTNISDRSHSVVKGDRIAQLVVIPVPDVKFVSVDVLDDTQRGTSGFGSTGSR